MYFDKAVIDHTNTTWVQAEDSWMTLTQSGPDEGDEAHGPIVLAVDELNDLIVLARALGWEINA